MLQKPVVSVCITYQKHKGLLKWVKHPRRTIYVSEPFFADASKSLKDAQKYLHERAYEFMCETTAQYSDYAYIEYVPRSEEK